jgi:hypothetical protein
MGHIGTEVGKNQNRLWDVLSLACRCSRPTAEVTARSERALGVGKMLSYTLRLRISPQHLAGSSQE